MSLSLLNPVHSYAFETLANVGGYFSKPEMLATGIYCISCDRNDLLYIGSTAGKYGFAKRFHGHLRGLIRSKHHSWILNRDFQRYGISSFTFHIIDPCVAGECLQREQIYLDLTSAGNELLSYNICPIAYSSSGRKISESSRLKGSATRKLRYMFYPMSQETKDKIGNAQRGKPKQPRTKETRLKMSLIHKARKIPAKQIKHIRKLGFASKGKQLSSEHCQKLSISHRGFVIPQETREKLRESLLGREITKEAREKIAAKAGGRFIVCSPEGVAKEVQNLSKFCRENGLDQGKMSSVACGARRSHKGWTCEKISSPNFDPERGFGARFLITNPQGETQEIFNLTKFCKENGLNRSGMSRLANGTGNYYKGWDCQRMA